MMVWRKFPCSCQTPMYMLTELKQSAAEQGDFMPYGVALDHHEVPACYFGHCLSAALAILTSREISTEVPFLMLDKMKHAKAHLHFCHCLSPQLLRSWPAEGSAQRATSSEAFPLLAQEQVPLGLDLPPLATLEPLPAPVAGLTRPSRQVQLHNLHTLQTQKQIRSCV